jgi:signal transduction histidine kinase
LLEVSEREWVDLAEVGLGGNILRPLKEIVQATDTFYWQAPIWGKLLRRVLAAEPAAIGVAFYFGEEARLDRLPSRRSNARRPDGPPLGGDDLRAIFEDPRITWSAELDASGRAAMPGLALAYNRNVGLKTLRTDDDGVVRRLVLGLAPVPHLALRLASALRPLASDSSGSSAWVAASSEPGILDYAGPAGTFPSYSFRDVLEGRVAPSAFAGKVVIVGPRDMTVSGALTPLGRMTRAEALANVVEDAVDGRWIRRAPSSWYLAMLAGLLALSVWALSSYPQSIALAFFTCGGLIWSAASAWAFDSRFFWLPVLAPMIQMTVTYIVFLSYQLARNEQKAWRLEQERRYQDEMESLKNNFVSMMSHDLKTPIAKIQAIADRALARTQELEEATDLRELLRASDDLHRYIRSILQVTKLEARDFQIRHEPIDPNESISRAIERLRPLAAEKGISLEQRLEPMFSIEADPTLIQEVALNLVENAIKYTPPGGHVRITSQETDDKVRVSVEDTGPGIELSEQAGIWGKFTRGRKQSEDAQGPPGSGLGLYLVKYFVELHGGRVFLESAPGKGTKIGFSIPVAATDEKTALEAVAPPIAPLAAATEVSKERAL